MTLENVFIGNKVVQRVYLNNAIIYQANGWESLPSTYQELWTKNYNFSTASNINTCFDTKNNLIITYTNSTKTAFMCKISPEGALLWNISIGSSIKTYNIKSDNNDNIYCVVSDYISGSASSYTSKIIKVDTHGNSTSYDMSTRLQINSVTYDSSHIYIGATTEQWSYAFLMIYDYSGKLEKSYQYGFQYCPSIVTNDKSDIYLSTLSSVYQIKKDDLSKANSISELGNTYRYNSSLLLDDLNNLYLNNKNELWKYSTLNKTKTIIKLKNVDYGNIYNISLDYQGNMYVFCYETQAGQVDYWYKKYSSNGSEIWTMKMPSDKTLNVSAIDNSGNIYIIYFDVSGYINLKKMINLVKKG